MTLTIRSDVAFAFVSALLLLVVGCQRSEAKESLPPLKGSGAPPPFVLPTVAASAGPVSFTEERKGRIVVTGTARPIRMANIGPRGSGVIAAMPVEEGDVVKKGQLLFSLESANQALAAAQARAALSGALITEGATKVELERVRRLHEAGSIAPAAYDAALVQHEAAKAAAKQAQAAVAAAQQASADTAIRAPIAGVVAKRMANIGDTVTMVPPTIVLVIQDISMLEVRGSVPETMLSELKPGCPITVRFLAVGIERKVEIDRINPSVDPMTRTIEVVAHVPNKDRSLRAGMLVELDFGSLSPTPIDSVGLRHHQRDSIKP